MTPIKLNAILQFITDGLVWLAGQQLLAEVLIAGIGVGLAAIATFFDKFFGFVNPNATSSQGKFPWVRFLIGCAVLGTISVFVIRLIFPMQSVGAVIYSTPTSTPSSSVPNAITRVSDSSLPLLPTQTFTHTPTRTSTATSSPTSTPTITPSSTSTPTFTPTPTATPQPKPITLSSTPTPNPCAAEPIRITNVVNITHPGNNQAILASDQVQIIGAISNPNATPFVSYRVEGWPPGSPPQDSDISWPIEIWVDLLNVNIKSDFLLAQWSPSDWIKKNPAYPSLSGEYFLRLVGKLPTSDFVKMQEKCWVKITVQQ